MTQAELADRLGLGRTSITNLERGEQNPPLSLLPLLAHSLGVDPVELVAEAAGYDSSQGRDSLVTAVADAELRRWAGKVIGDTIVADAIPADSAALRRSASSTRTPIVERRPR